GLERPPFQPAVLEEAAHGFLAADGEQAQPLLQPVGHLLRGLARERDREDLARLDAGEEQPQDARTEQPRLAAPRASLDHDAATRVERRRRERRRLRLAHAQCLRRHSPCISQYWHTASMPWAGSGAPALKRSTSSSSRLRTAAACCA